jgi:hypothetical protein
MEAGPTGPDTDAMEFLKSAWDDAAEREWGWRPNNTPSPRVRWIKESDDE